MKNEDFVQIVMDGNLLPEHYNSFEEAKTAAEKMFTNDETLKFAEIARISHFVLGGVKNKSK